MRILPVAAAALLATGAVACSSSDSSKAAPTPAPASAAPSTGATTSGGGTVHDLKALSGNRWSVSTLDLKAGDTVKVTDTDPDVPHNFVVKGVGQSPPLRAGDTFTLTFPKAGTYEFVCTYHADLGMTGTIKVS